MKNNGIIKGAIELKSKIALGLLITGATAFANSKTDTYLGKAATYFVDDVFGNIGFWLLSGVVMVKVGLRWLEDGQLKHLGVGLGVVALIAAAFAVGPDLYSNMRTVVGF